MKDFTNDVVVPVENAYTGYTLRGILKGVFAIGSEVPGKKPDLTCQHQRSRRMEQEGFDRACRFLNLATPTQVQSILWDDDEDSQRLHISVARAGDFDLNKLARQVHPGHFSVQIDDRLEASNGASSDCRRAKRRLSFLYAISAATCSTFVIN